MFSCHVSVLQTKGQTLPFLWVPRWLGGQLRQKEHGAGCCSCILQSEFECILSFLVFSKLNLMFFILYLFNSLKHPFNGECPSYYIYEQGGLVSG